MSHISTTRKLLIHPQTCNVNNFNFHQVFISCVNVRLDAILNPINVKIELKDLDLI